MKSEIKLCCILLLIGASCPCWADFKVTKTGDSVVDPTALTLSSDSGRCINAVHCQQDAVVTHGKYQYVGYYDAERRVCLARRKLPAGDWRIIRFGDYVFRKNDDHNTICIGVCPRDGTIHLAFDHHSDPLHYRRSRKGVATDPESVKWEASLFGPIASELEKGKPPSLVTYPRFWQTPDGGLQFCYRVGWTGNGDRMLVDYDADTGTWINTRQIDSRKGRFKKSSSRCSYPNGYDYGPLGRLHVTWVWRERTQVGRHDLMYAYSEDRGRTWRNNQGKALTGPPHIGSPGIKVVDISRAYLLMNTQSQAVDSQGRIHAVMWHTTDETLKAAKSKPEGTWGPPDARRYHHYFRDKKGTWHHRQLPWVSGTIPKLFIDKDNNAYLIYGRANPGIHMKIQDLDHNCTIAAASASSNWTDWKVIHVEKGHFFSDMLGDLYRWKKEGVLSVVVQESPKEMGAPTPLRILDFSFGKEIDVLGKDNAPLHPIVGKRFVPTDVDFDNPVYESSFDSPAELRDWKLEGGKRMTIADGHLVLESEPSSDPKKISRNHLVCWLTKEIPADFLLEFTVRPRDRKNGLNIVFFNTRGVNGENIFQPPIKPRDGTFRQYHRGDLNSYHVSYWASDRGFANLRKNRGFHRVASGQDLIAGAKPEVFQTVRIYKRAGNIRIMVDDVVAVSFDDDGKKFGPVHTHSGWIGLRQMGFTLRCEYGHVKVWPLKK